MTRIWYDCEFLEDGRTIDLISIGMVREDGAEYYAVNSAIDDYSSSETARLHKRISKHDWLMENVVPHLPVHSMPSKPYNAWVWSLDHSSTLVKPRRVIANEVREFILNCDKPQLRAWYGAYDHVALMQLWGPMISKPERIPMWTYDLKQECERLGSPQVPEQAGDEHHALADARWNRSTDLFLEQYREDQARDHRLAADIG